jgi:hypothetical protein
VGKCWRIRTARAEPGPQRSLHYFPAQYRKRLHQCASLLALLDDKSEVVRACRSRHTLSISPAKSMVAQCPSGYLITMANYFTI